MSEAIRNAADHARERREARHPDGAFLMPRASWGAGPWHGEPDRVEWRDAASGWPLLIVRNMLGAFCGYVGLPPEHPWHELDWSDIEEDIDVHGSLTWAGRSSGPILYRLTPGELGDVWWLGFDCCHAWDLEPALYARLNTLGRSPFRDDRYWTVEQVTAEVERLCAQLVRYATAAKTGDELTARITSKESEGKDP